VTGGDPVVKAREDEMASGSRLRAALTGLVAMTAWQV
jgi:hypothetical protein